MSSEVMAGLADQLAIWRNPVFLRFKRSRLRLRKSIFWILLTLIVTTFAVSLTYIISRNMGTPAELAARRLWIPLLVIQGLILLIKGTGSVAAGLIQDKIDETLDYQRLTPMTPVANLLGYLFGLPVLEYLMFALTLPHLTFVVIVGHVPIATVASVYLTFFCCAILYHMTGIAAGMTMRRWIWGYMLSVFLVFIVNIILPTFISQLGLKFIQYLSMWPVVSQKVAPLMLPPGFVVGPQNLYLSFADAVPFYNWTLSPFVFTLLLQTALIVTFFTMALRRWQSATKHSLSKPYALGFLAAFIVMLIGNVWPAITGQYMPFAIFGETNIEALREGIAIAFPLVYCFVVWLLCFILFAIVIPSHHAVMRGLRRAAKLGRARPVAWDDDSASVPFMMLFVVVAVSGFGVLFSEIAAAGFLEFLDGSDLGFWRLPVALTLVLVYTVLVLQVLELKPTMLAILLVWFLPILVAALFSAAIEGFYPAQAIIASASPIALLAMSAFVPLTSLAPPGVGEQLNSVVSGVYAGLFFITLQIAWLAYKWGVLQRRHAALCDTSGRDRRTEIACATPAET